MSHPDIKQLQLFAWGRLGDVETEQIEEHLENCPECLRRVTEFERSPADPLVENLQAIGRGERHSDSGSDNDSDSTASFTDRTVEPPAPDSIGNYTILGVLGSGGMGTVYRGMNPHLQRHAAIKIVKPSWSLRESSVERFQRELVANGKLQHRHIVATFDGGMFENRPYLVMELLDGTDLARYVKDHGPLPIKEACEIIRQVALGLQYVHEAGLIHRDIKPSNLFRTSDETVKILDLGLARLMETEVREASQGISQTLGETLEGHVLGTPDYMSPEQAVDSKSVGFQSDVYSLGCTFFYLLTGQAPFAETPGVTAKIDAHVKRDLPSLKRFRRDVPPAIKKLLQMMTSKMIAVRPRAVEVVTVLKRCIKIYGKDTIVRYLKKAGRFGDVDRVLKRVKNFVSNGADVNAKNEKGDTPLHLAVGGENRVKIARFLVSKGADVHAKNDGGATPLHNVRDKNIETAQFLVSQGADVNAKDHNGKTLLHKVAILTKSVDVARFLVSHGADVNVKDAYGLTPLLWSVVRNENFEIVRLLVSSGADIHAKTANGSTALHMVARSNSNLVVAKYLLSLGADLHAKANDGATPLHWAAGKNKNVQVVQYLVSQGANVNAKTNGRILSNWDEEGNTGDVLSFSFRIRCLAGGVDITEKNDGGTIPLHWAVRWNGNIEIAQLLVSQGADVHAKNDEGDTPLHWAAEWKEDDDIAQYLISQGADVLAKNVKGNTPLHLAVEKNKNIEVTKVLVALGADVHAKNNEGKPPLHLAVESNENIDVAEFLVSQGADVNAKNDQGGTPLHVTAGSNCDARVLQFLITHGADINTKDNEGATPLHSAALLNDKGETVQFLISQGADVHAKDTGDMTPLHWAVGRKNDIKIAKIFGEDANTKADGGCTSLHLAELLEFNVDVVQSLVSQGADVNAKDDEGDTPLHWAARSHHGDDNVRFVVEGDNAHARDDIGGATRLVEESQKIVEIARLLISHGASVQAKNKKGQTPLDLAKEKNNVTLTEYLSGITEQMETAFPPTPTTQ